MGCKHEGGTDTCVRYKRRDCKVLNAKRVKKYKQDNPGRIQDYSRAYRKENILSGSSAKGSDIGKVTAACEHFVSAELLRRGNEVTKPLSPTAKHDLHVKIGRKWHGVQVKSASLNKATGTMYCCSGSMNSIDSPIIALVYLPLWKIEYRPGTAPLPPELETKLEKEIKEFETWQRSSTSADHAAKNLKDAVRSQTQKESPFNSAENAASN